jgi:hypothetical protein
MKRLALNAILALVVARGCEVIAIAAYARMYDGKSIRAIVVEAIKKAEAR